MSFTNAVKAYFTKWIDFRSRSSRSEFWWAFLFIILFSLAQFIIEFIVVLIFVYAGFSESEMMENALTIGIWFYTIGMFALGVFFWIASTCLTIRRLHDLDKSGWWQLIMFTIIGIIPLIIWYCTKGTDGDNRFGKDPLEQLQ